MSDFTPGQIVTVFRNRLDPDGIDGYPARAQQMESLARTMPGFVDVKSFVADDGERVTISTFADAESVRAWKAQADHQLAQAEGRAGYYASYSIQVCETVRAGSFTAPREGAR
jgi:heme-degrading monooxygenase HmoA